MKSTLFSPKNAPSSLTCEQKGTNICKFENKGAQVVALLGIDVGTSELKAALFNEGGECLALTSAEYDARQPRAGLAELDPELLWRSVCGAVRKIVSHAPEQRVHALAFSVHGESFAGLDVKGNAVGPVILNVDGRATAEMDEFVTAFGRERLYEITGLPPHPMYTLPKIAWLRKHSPETFATVQRFVCIQDYLLFRGSGEASIDCSLASRTLGFDIEHSRWDAQLLGQAGLSESHMSQVVAGGVAVGKATATVAEQMGLPSGTVWVSGGHDQACTSIGAGGLTAGTAVDGTGTFECISVATPNRLPPAMALRANLPCERHSAPGHFLSLAYAPGGIVLKWLRDQCGRDVVEEAHRTGGNSYDLLLAHAPEEPTGLIFLPYLFGTGTPWLDSAARGVIHGLSFGTTRESLAKAALEGVTCEMRWNLEMLQRLRVPVERVVAVGGGSKSGTWLQLKADMFGREVTAVAGEAACRGAAICAGVGSGVYPSFESAVAAAVPAGTTYEPRTAIHRRYTEIFEQYKELANRLYGYELPESGSQTHA
jgi:xylulokinase